ncbi:hypothetical protein BGZ75_008260 [Mortierella antarctica]|nr:hypothetical protein BGZ75_008260 [Mortierella antarctica]
MGLTGNLDSQGQQLHQTRLAQVHQDDEQGSSLRYLDANCAEENEEHRLRKTSKSRADLEHPNAKTGGPTHGIYSTTSAPFSAQEFSLDHDQPQEAQSPISGIRMQDGHLSSAFDNDKLSSENVQLFLDHDGSASEFHMIFKPSLLLKRFQAWTGTMESHGTLSMSCNESNDSGFSADHEDPSLLNELGEIMSSKGLDLDAYMHLCSRHRPRSLPYSMSELSSSTLGNENAGSTDMPESSISGKKDEPDLLDEYCTLDESSQETISRSEQEQDTVMRLPRILSWFVSSQDTASADTTAQESHTCCPGPDFILQDTTMDCEADSFQATAQGTLRDIWTNLNKQQQQRLMLTLVKMLVGIWNNFDILSHNELRGSLEPSKDARFDDPLEPLLEQCGVRQYASSLQQLPPRRASHRSPISDRGQSSSPRRREGSAGRTPVRVSAAERLVILEDEFLNRSFLDAFMHATAPSPSGNGLSPDNIVSVFDENLIPVPQELSQPEKRRRIDTKQDEYPQRSASHGRSAREEGMSRILNSMGSSQRMTTTSAEVLEFVASQKSRYVVTPVDGDVSAGTGMRQFDFSMDDLLVAVTNETYPQDGSGQLCPTEYSECDIVGVSRWKASDGTRTLESQTPRGNNMYQVRARESAYPLVHLFSLPDIFCPVELGGQCSVKNLDSGGIAGEFVQMLGHHSLGAGEFMTDTLPDKERVLYHRWMAAWHERSPLAPKASKMRFELMRMVSRHKLAGAGHEAQWEHLNTARTFDNNDDDDCNSDEEGAGVELEGAAPQPYKPICPIQQGHGHGQQPSGGGVSSSVAANLKARCSRCVDMERKQEMTSEDKAWFESTAQFLDEVQAEEKRRWEQQEIRRRSRTQRDQALDHIARRLGLGKQWTKQGQALGLQLDAFEVPSTDGTTEAVDETGDSLGGRPKPTWILSAKEREIMRNHLFGQSDQAAVSAGQSNVSLQHSAC